MINQIKKVSFVLLLTSLQSCVVVIESGTHQSVKSMTTPTNTWISLFNGQDLTGWTPKFAGHEAGINYLDTFGVENGKLIVNYDKYKTFDKSPFGHLITDIPYENYHLKVEYRFIGKQATNSPELSWAYRNNGLMLHSQSAESMSLTQAFPLSAEAQLLGGDGENPRSTGNVCTPYSHIIQKGRLIKEHCLNSSSATFHGDQWVTFEAKVYGTGRVEQYINGELVFEYDKLIVDTSDDSIAHIFENMAKDSDGNIPLTQGHIAIQAESHPTEFRLIELKSL
jgi:hypothetical protein